MSNEPLGEQAPPSSPPPPQRAKRILCDFCKCELSSTGDVLKMSEEAKSMRDRGDSNETLNNKLAIANEEIESLKRKLEEASKVPPPQEEGRPGKKWPGFKN